MPASVHDHATELGRDSESGSSRGDAKLLTRRRSMSLRRRITDHDCNPSELGDSPPRSRSEGRHTVRSSPLRRSTAHGTNGKSAEIRHSPMARYDAVDHPSVRATPETFDAWGKRQETFAMPTTNGVNSAPVIADDVATDGSPLFRNSASHCAPNMPPFDSDVPYRFSMAAANAPEYVHVFHSRPCLIVLF